jgi:two-component system response regulator NreC
VKLALVDDHPVFREALKLLLPREDPNLDVVAEAASARDAIPMIQWSQPDLVVMDLAFPESNGLVAIRELRRLGSKARFLVLSALAGVSSVMDALVTGADGYALKTQPIDAIARAIRTVLRGDVYLPPGLENTVECLRLQRGSMNERLIDRLSPREREVFDLVISGHTNQNVARLCFISQKTVETHRTRINTKLGTHSTGDLIRFAVLQGIGVS